MSVVVTEENQQKVVLNQAKLDKVKEILGAKTESETLELALKKVIEEFEKKQLVNDLPDDFFEDLLAEKTNLSDGESIQAVIKEREEAEFDADSLNLIPPKKEFKVKANFTVVGRRKPMKYDFADFVENVHNQI